MMTESSLFLPWSYNFAIDWEFQPKPLGSHCLTGTQFQILPARLTGQTSTRHDALLPRAVVVCVSQSIPNRLPNNSLRCPAIPASTSIIGQSHRCRPSEPAA